MQTIPSHPAIVQPVTPDGLAGFDKFGQFIIVTQDQYLKEKGSIRESYQYSIYRDVRPYTCCICGNGWQNTTESLLNQNILDNGGKIAHRTCVKGFNNLTNSYELTGMFVGLVAFHDEEIPDGYSSTRGEYWYKINCLRENEGVYFIVGWRKRVINLEMHGVSQGVARDISNSFMDQDVTKDVLTLGAIAFMLTLSMTAKSMLRL
jgi:hypothetical protein